MGHFEGARVLVRHVEEFVVHKIVLDRNQAFQILTSKQNLTNLA